MIDALLSRQASARLQVIVWALVSGSVQVKSPVTEPTTRRPSTVSVRVTLSASETPSLVTVRVNVWLAPPAVAVSLLKTLVTDSWTSSTMATVSVASAAVSSSEAALPRC